MASSFARWQYLRINELEERHNSSRRREHMNLRRLALTALTVLGVALTASYATQPGKLSGEIKADGSSTVYLITEAVADNFRKAHPDVNISVGISGTGGGFKKFAAGETDISNASRVIKPQEIENCKKNGIEFLELQI